MDIDEGALEEEKINDKKEKKRHKNLFNPNKRVHDDYYGGEYDEEEEDEYGEEDDEYDDEDEHHENVFNQQNAFGMQVF